MFGPTGVGKTRLLYTFFTKGYEVINADSMQVYRGLDIGSAKPSQKILQLIPHHLIDILEPTQQYTVGDFVRYSQKLIPQVHQRGALPVVSGGTAFYFKHLMFGLPEAPPSDPMIREELEERCQKEGEETLYKELHRIDPVSWKRIHSSDTYRILRALEVFYTSGRPLASYKIKPTVDQQMRPLIIGLRREREELNRRIDQRVEMMFDDGLVNEIRTLIGKGASPDWPGMHGIGYREFFLARETGELSLSGIKEQIQRNSRHYAKRQMTFFRSLPGVNWVHPDDKQQISRLLQD